MRRRDFIAALGGAASWPLVARAQPADRARRIGVLMSIAADDPEAERRVAAFREALHGLGWTDGGNLRINFRWAGGDIARMRFYAAELAKSAPDVMLAWGYPSLRALREAAPGAPIVFGSVMDPVGNGVVINLAHPGGNVTGFSSVEFDMAGKWLDLLKEAAPHIGQVAVIVDPLRPYETSKEERQFIEHAGASLSLKPIWLLAHDVPELEAGLLAAGPGSGLLVLPSGFSAVHRDLIVGLAARYRMPAIYPYRYFAAIGGLMSYGIDQTAQMRQAASYVGRILKGEKPGDLPVQQATKFEFVINLKTAKALGLTVPLPLLGRADEVIE